MKKDGVQSRYFVEAAAKALDVLEAFDSPHEELSASEVARRARIPHSSAFRLLYTLEMRGYVMRLSSSKKFRRTPSTMRCHIGYAAIGDKLRFSKEVSHGIAVAARMAGIDLIVKNNDLSAQKALANVDILIEGGIDLLIEHQLDETTAHLIAAKCHDANVPVLAINNAQPGAYYFGGNNYQAGRMAGEFMCKFVKTTWRGKWDKIIILSGKGMGSTLEVRKTGICEALEHSQVCRESDLVLTAPTITVQDGYRAAKETLLALGNKAQRILIAALGDGPAIGACRAVKQLGLVDRVAIVSQGGSADIRSTLREKGPLKASVAYFPETYGDRVISLALRILARENVPLTSYTSHVVLTTANVEQYYPAVNN